MKQLLLLISLVGLAMAATSTVYFQAVCSDNDRDDERPPVLTLPEKSQFFVPFAANFSRATGPRHSNRNLVLTITRNCGAFDPLVCIYNGTVLGFQGCFKNGVIDPFFVEGQEVYFPSTVSFAASCQEGHDHPITLSATAVVRQPCDSFNTPQENLIQAYETAITTLVFGPVYMMFAPDIVFNVNGFVHPFLGRDAAFAYVNINDPNISDLFAIIGSQPTVTTQSRNVVAARVYQTWKSLQLPDGNPLQIWNNNQYIEFVFNEYNQFSALTAFLDTAAFIIRFPQSENPNITATCEAIQQTCSSPSLVQYTSVADCVSFMNSIAANVPLQPPTAGNSVQCRAFHEVLARSLPAVHCPHTGKAKISPFATPCQDF